jgi:hypothetical protein
MPRPHFYVKLDEGEHRSRLTVELSTREVAERLCAMNHGVHRLLSHLIDVRRERLAKRIEGYREKGDDDIAESLTKIGDPLADGIEKLLLADLY